MNGCSVFLNYLYSRDVFPYPVAPFFAGDHAACISGYTIEEVCKSGENLAEALMRTSEIYGTDLILVFSDVTVEAEAMGVELEFSKFHTPHILTYPDLSSITPKDPLVDGRMPEILVATQKIINTYEDIVQVCTAIKDPFSLAVLLREPNEFYIDLIRNPKTNIELLEIATANQLKYLHEIMKTGAIPLIGAPFSSGSLISPETFDKFAAPYLNRLIEVIRYNDIPVFIHICGDSRTIIENIARLEPDILSVDELNIADFASKYPDILFMGNLSTSLINSGHPLEIAAETRKMIKDVNGKFIPSTGCDIPMKTPVKNVLAMTEAIKDFCL